MSRDLIIPIYVDTNSLLDLLASIEGGFSVVEKITTQNTNTKGTNLEGKVDGSTDFGIPNVLSLLKLNLGLSGTHNRSTEITQGREAEKYHTFGSLFFRLREYLEDKGLIKRLDDGETSWQAIEPSDFVEIHGIIQPNPLATSMHLLDRILVLADLATLLPTANISVKPHSQERNSQPKRQNNRQGTQNPTSDVTQLRAFLKGLLGDIENEQVRSFIVNSTEKFNYQAVVVLFLDYLRDKTMIQLNNKEYHLLGKVVRKVEPNTDDTIDLLTGTGLGGVGDTILEQLTSSIDQIPNVKLPMVKTKIVGPALEIVPIAIFV